MEIQMESVREEGRHEEPAARISADRSSFAERVLYWLAKRLYRTELAQTEEMKAALSDPVRYAEYREAQIMRVRTAAANHGFAFSGAKLLDIGCNDGCLTRKYLECGASSVVGIDIDAAAIERARAAAGTGLEFHAFDGHSIPLADASVDSIISYDVFEHMVEPRRVLKECRRVLKPGGKMLIGTWGWRHPFAPHLWALMPVPWAHLFVSDKKLLRVCRRVYRSPWYVPNMFDFDKSGNRLPDRFVEETIPRDYLNRYLIRDFERDFQASGLRYRLHLEPFGLRFAMLFRPLLRVPWLREYLHGYMWIVLTN